MSKTVEKREVEKSVYVYRCDRCSAEMCESERYGVTKPGEGTQISSRSDAAWEPLLPPSGADNYSLAEASNVDLCDACLAELRAWMRAGSFQDRDPASGCPGCGGDRGDNWFDRSLCYCEPDGVMHTRCRKCGSALDFACSTSNQDTRGSE